MTEHLKLIKENAYLKLGIITLIEEIDKERQLNGIKVFLKALIGDAEENTKKKTNVEDMIKFLDGLKESK